MYSSRRYSRDCLMPSSAWIHDDDNHTLIYNHHSPSYHTSSNTYHQRSPNRNTTTSDRRRSYQLSTSQSTSNMLRSCSNLFNRFSSRLKLQQNSNNNNNVKNDNEKSSSSPDGSSSKGLPKLDSIHEGRAVSPERENAPSSRYQTTGSTRTGTGSFKAHDGYNLNKNNNKMVQQSKTNPSITTTSSSKQQQQKQQSSALTSNQPVVTATHTNDLHSINRRLAMTKVLP